MPSETFATQEIVTTDPLPLKVWKSLKNPALVLEHLRWRIGIALLVKRIRREGKLYHEYEGELYPDHLAHGNARSFIEERALQVCQGTGIDVGADRWPFPGAKPIRLLPHENAYQLDTIAGGSLDYIFSSHCLEHLEHWQDALRLWITKLKTGGVLFLYVPHQSMKLWNPGSPWVRGAHKWQPTHEVLVPFLKGHGMEVFDFNTGRDEYWSFHVAARRTQ